MEQPDFGALLRQLRHDAGLTQEELAQAAGLSPRSVSDLERGVNRTARKETARLLSEALGLDGPRRTRFEAMARGRHPRQEPPGTGVVTATPPGAGSVASTTPRTLPRDVTGFTGRSTELARLADALTGARAAGGVIGLGAIYGMAGVGKTTLAVHVAHQLAADFPDGQLFLTLFAHTPGQRPVEPTDALADLLVCVGIGAQNIPPGLSARSALWRTYLAGKKILLLLDDAASHEQVTPLLPGTAGSAVLVTGRRRLTALPDAVTVSLDTVEPHEAVTLLARLADRPGLDPGDDALAELTRLCGYLPLAIGILARQLHHHPAWSTADLAGDLSAAVDRLELLHAENLSVGAAFALSYQRLTAPQQRLFRRLGLHPGNDIDAYAAAALCDTDLPTARRWLAHLGDHHLLRENTYGRYRTHDLLREYARQLVAADDEADNAAATGRLLDFYVHTAVAASRTIENRKVTVHRPLPGSPPTAQPPLDTAGQAGDWLDRERANLYAATVFAAESGWPAHASAIPLATSSFLFARGHWDQAAAMQVIALAVTRRAGDRCGEAAALHAQACLRRARGDFVTAAADHRAALRLYRGLGERLGEAMTLIGLGIALRDLGRYPAAEGCQRRALAVFRELGHQAGQGLALTSLGNVQARTGDYRGAATSHRSAMRHFCDIGDRFGQALSTGNLGSVLARTGDYPAGAVSLSRALDIYRAIGDRLNQAAALTHLGEIRQTIGDHPAANACYREALDIFQSLGNRYREAMVIRNIGRLQSATGDAGSALAHLEQALDMYQEARDPGSQAQVLNDLGDVLAGEGHHDRARGYHTRALALARDISSPLEEARALEGIGVCLTGAHDVDGGAACWTEALAIYQKLGAPGAQRVGELLRRRAAERSLR